MPTVEELLAVAESDMDAKTNRTISNRSFKYRCKNKRDTDTRWGIIIWC